MKEIKSSYKSLISYLSKETDVADACLKFHNVYEGSADTASRLTGRINKAKAIYNKYHKAATHNCPAAGLIDVPAYGHWAHEGIDYCVKQKLMEGTGGKNFRPDDPVTRAQLVTILYRAAGSPTVKFKGTFTDVASGAWYAGAVEWAASKGIVNGIGDGRFAPDQRITREQLAVILYRYQNEPKVSGNLGSFPDKAKVSSFASDAMIWATKQGLINGISGNGTTILAPQSHATRAQLASIIARFLQA